MTNTEAIFIWTALWFYGVSFTFYLYSAVFKKEKGARNGWYLGVTGFLLQSASIGIRWNATGHPPAMREYENALLGSVIILIIFGILRYWHRRIEVVGVAVIPVVLLTLGNGIMKRPYLEPMAPPFKSNWLWLHLYFAWIAYGAFCIGAGLGILYLLKDRAQAIRRQESEHKRGEGWEAGFVGRLPELGIMNDLMLKIIIFGFVALTVQIGAGSLWAFNLWGRYWGWDPIETWSLVTWLVYGTYIHLGITLGWKGRRMAWLAIIAIISLFITYGGIGYMGSVHTTMM